MDGTLNPRSDFEEQGCPRCGRPLPVGYPGALSRYGNYEICSLCGTDEAMRPFRGLKTIMPEDWPLTGTDAAALDEWEAGEREMRRQFEQMNGEPKPVFPVDARNRRLS